MQTHSVSSPEPTCPDWLPPQVKQLAPREREVAGIIYSNGASTAKQVEMSLSTQITNGAVRSMLVRLMRKGILTRSPGNRGPGNDHVYFPAITPAQVKEGVLKQIADRFFDGSLANVAIAILNLMEREPSRAAGNPAQSRARTSAADALDRLAA